MMGSLLTTAGAMVRLCWLLVQVGNLSFHWVVHKSQSAPAPPIFPQEFLLTNLK